MGALRAQRIERGLRLGVPRLQRERPLEIRERQRRSAGGTVQTSLCRENRRSIRGQRFRAAQHVGPFPEPRRHGQRVAEAEQRVHVLRLRRDDRLIHVGRPLGMPQLHVKARNPEARLDVVRVECSERLKLLQGLLVRPRSCEALCLGALVLRLWRGQQRQPDDCG